MRKILIFLTLILLLFPVISFAEKELNYKSLAVEQLYQYGQEIYDRGDYNQASRVFSRILVIQPNHEGALGYVEKLKSKGKDVIATTGADTNNEEDRAMEVSNGSNDDLKQSIQAANEAINALKNDIAQLHVHIDQINNEK